MYDLRPIQASNSIFWGGVAQHTAVQRQLIDQVLLWLADSNYYNAGYKQQGPPIYKRNWPTPEAPSLTGPPIDRRPLDL